MALEFKLQRVRQPDETVDALNETQENIAEIVRKLNLEPLVNGVFLTDISLSTTSELIRHGLGFEPRGWLVLNKTASFDIYKDTALANPSPTQFVALRTSAGTHTVNLYIF